METQVEVFWHEMFGEVRVVDRNGDPWFVAKNVCDALGLDNVSQAVVALDDDEKDDIISNDVTGRRQEMTIVSESGLYSLIMRSRKPEAKVFKRWVTHEVLPAIRKHGEYVPSRPKELAVDANALIELVDRLKLAEGRVDVLKPKTPYGSISEYNGRERIQLIRAYWRSLQRDMLLAVTDEYQRQLFDFR